MESAGMVPERPRWVIVAQVDRPAIYRALGRSYAGSAWVAVVIDRRRGERRQTAPGSGDRELTADRRLAGRRSGDRHPAQTPNFRRAQMGDGFEVAEATGPESGRCPQCG